MLVANYISKLKGKGSGYWIRLAIFVLLGTLAASWVGNWSIWIDARFKIYQALQSMLPGRGPYVQNTFLILIHDEDYWEGKLDQRVPIKRDYLADLVDALAKDNVGIIVLDFDLRSPMPSGAPAGSDKYSDETKKLAQAIQDASRDRIVILPKTVGLDEHDNYVADADVIDHVDGIAFGDQVHHGYIALPSDIRQVPMTLSLKDGSRIDSLAEATVRAWSEQALEGSSDSEDSPPFAGFLSQDQFRDRIVDAGELLGNPQHFKAKLQAKIVIIGGAWHTYAYQRGPIVDSYYTPAGYMPGSMIHANYVEALLARRVYTPMAEWVSRIIEFTLVLLTVLVFALDPRPLRKVSCVLGLVVICILTSYVAFTNFGIFFDFLIPLIAVATHAGVEQVKEWRHGAHAWSLHQASRHSASKPIVSVVVLGMLLSVQVFQHNSYALTRGAMSVTQSDTQDVDEKSAAGSKKKPKPIDPNQPGGPRETTTGGSHGSTTTTGTRTSGTTNTGVRSTTPGGPRGSRSGTTLVATRTTAGGSTVATRSNGKVSDVHVAGKNMDIHNNLNGSRSVSVTRADGSRVVATGGGHGYVERGYHYGGHDYGRRSYYYGGRYYNGYYRGYYYGGYPMYAYAPAYYYGPAFYGWAYNPWAAPIVYSWGWAGNPWYGYYGGYFAPYPEYHSAVQWLTDYLVSQSLAAAYQEQQADAQAAAAARVPPGGSPVLDQQTKDMIAEEVKRQIALENQEAQANAHNQDVDPASSGIARMLSDNQTHVFIAGSSLDVVQAANQAECGISSGDVLKVTAAPASGATAATATVLSSKGGNECAKNAQVQVAFADLQEMQNHMRQTIDQGLGELQAKQGQGGLPAAPPSAKSPPVQAAYVRNAPPPEQDIAVSIKQESQQADQAEQEAAKEVPQPGETVDQVTAALGQPKSVVKLGTKEIYVYPDMKVTFKNGTVSDVQ